MPIVSDQSAGLVLRSAQERPGDAINVRPPTDPFGYALTTQKTPQIALLSAFGTSALRDVETVAGSGGISASAGEIVVSTGATVSSSALLETARWGNYQPGFAAEVGIGIRIPTAPTGDQVARWGLRENVGDNGFYFGLDATGLFVARKTGGTETVIRQAAWNGDKLDGTGPSGLTLDVADGFIWHVDFTHYGHGDVRFQVNLTVGGVEIPVTVHTVDVTGAVSIQDPNLPVFVEAENGATASDFAVYVGGRQYSIKGPANETFRYTAASRGSVSTSTTVEPLVTFRAKSAFQNRTVQVDGFEVIVATANTLIQVYLDATLTGASYATPGDHTAAETAVEADVSATALTGGVLIWQQLVPSGGNPQSPENFADRVRLTLPAQQPVTLAAKTLSGTGTIISNFRVRELW